MSVNTCTGLHHAGLSLWMSFFLTKLNSNRVSNDTIHTVKVKMGSCYLEELFLPYVTPKMIFTDVAQCIMVESFILNIFVLNIVNLDVKQCFFFTMYKNVAFVKGSSKLNAIIYVSICLDQTCHISLSYQFHKSSTQIEYLYVHSFNPFNNTCFISCFGDHFTCGAKCNSET